MEDRNRDKNRSHSDLVRKYMTLCSRREYAGWDILIALKRKGVSEIEALKIVETLKEEGFVNDTRYVNAFVRDKMLLAGWGRNKVEYQLKMKDFDSDIIKRAIEEVDGERVENRMAEVIERKYRSLNKEEDQSKRRAKVIRFALSRGFSYSETDRILKKIERSINDNI